MKELLITATSAANEFKVSKSWVHDLCKRKLLTKKYLHLGSRCYVIENDKKYKKLKAFYNLKQNLKGEKQ